MEKNKIEKVYDQIHAPESLKEKTFQKIKQTVPEKKKNYKFILSIAAMFVLAIAIGTTYYINKPVLEEELEETKLAIEIDEVDLNHFKNIEDLREYFDKNYEETAVYYDSGINDATEQTESILKSNDSLKERATEDFSESSEETSNYYKTNTQVENVDEADIVKTDGNYIYYITNNTIYIVKADEFKIESKLDFSLSNDDNSRYYPSELFIKDDKLIVIGNFIKYFQENSLQDTFKNRNFQVSICTTKAYIYDIKDKTTPKELRQVDIDGDYNTSRIVGNTLYLMSTKYMSYTPAMKDSDILPLYYDTAFLEEYKNVDCKNIVYNENSSDNTYQTIGAVNIENTDNELLVETFLGYGNTIYCSENNLYIASPIYDNESTQNLNSTQIYKFNISAGGLKYSCKTTIAGEINNQFSLDEYDGNLRVATTVTIEEEPEKISNDNGYEIVELGKNTTNNILYVLDENLEKIGELTDFGIEEKIYSVRFIGEVAYIVTFEQIDPLFVMDLSDPHNPVMKGKLEIPGYSSYLHPYDENHIIGIGYNVKDNGYGGVTNERIKLSMFDVSDLTNPKEVFTKTLGEGYSYSNVIYDHKLLMYDKQRDLIGFPITMKNQNGKMQDTILLLKIDLENQEFKIHSQYTMENYNYFMRKVIYIEDTLYILCDGKILAFDINTSDTIGILELPYDRKKLSDTELLNTNEVVNVEE